MHGEELVVSIGLHQVACGRQQFQPDQQGEESSDEEEECNREQVEQRNPLVIGRQQPRLDSKFLIQIGLAFRGDCCRGHYCCTLGFCGFVPGGVRLGLPAAPDGLWFKDFTYATNAFNCSSLTIP